MNKVLNLPLFFQNLKTQLFLIAACCLISFNASAFDKHKSNTMMMQSGKSVSRFGNGLKDSDGTVYMKYGNAIKDSKGNIWQLFGNSIKRKSDGKTCVIFGNSIKCK
jgi:hypothetical protein